jgi:F0F1-type ATP synthase membrane subunit c/vacuolar-type H+-ATPase subunit K
MGKKARIFCSIFVLLTSIGFLRTFAYTIGFTIDANPQEYPEGSIVSTKVPTGRGTATTVAEENSTYKLSNEYHSSHVIGVVTEQPGISLEGKDFTNLVYLMDTGNLLVRVSGKNGTISRGEYITSSETPGVGMKATESGFAIGRALADVSFQKEDAENLVLVNLNIGYANIPTTYRRNLLNMLKEGISSPVMYPLDALRYFLAAALVTICVIAGMFSFSKIASNSVQAIGRNPNAQKQIRGQTRHSFLLTLIVIVVGLAIAYVILVA